MFHLRKVLGKYKISELCFGVILLLAIVYMSIICYCNTISGDEYFSAGFANNTKGFLFLTGSTLDEYENAGWIDGDFLRDYLSVQKGERFSVLNIHRNIRDDVHPPLYFMLLNVLSSFFIDEIPYFPGFLINIISGVIICLMMYLVGRKIYTNHWLALGPPMIWLVGEGAEFVVTYIRMYAPLCALCMVCIYLHVLLFEKEQSSKWIYVSIALCTMIGVLTHYYFYIMLGVIGLISTIRLLCRRKYKKFMAYAISHVCGWVPTYVAWPYVFEHVLFSERSVGAQGESKTGGLEYYVDFAGDFIQTLNDYVYNNSLRYILILFIFISAIAVSIKLYRRNKGIDELRGGVFVDKAARNNYFSIFLYMFGYLILLFFISYSAGWNYLSPVYPLLAIVTVGLFAWVLEKISKARYAYILVIVFLVMMMHSMAGRVVQDVGFYKQRELRHAAITEYSDTCDVLFFYTQWNNIYNNQMQELMEFDQIYSININELETSDYESILSGRKTKQDIVIYIPTETENYSQKAVKLAEIIGSGEPRLIMEDMFAIYYLNM